MELPCVPGRGWLSFHWKGEFYDRPSIRFPAGNPHYSDPRYHCHPGLCKSSAGSRLYISGLRKEPRVLVGRAGLKIPFFEQLDKLYLGQITVDIKTDEFIPTNDFINVTVDAVAKIRVADEPERMKLAMKNFLNKEPAKIAMDLQDSLQGNMREIIGTLTLRAINTDRDSFSDQVMTKASRDMEKLGIEILSCNIQNVTDEHGLIQDLGMDNTAKIRKDASIAKAEAERYRHRKSCCRQSFQ